MNRKPQKVRGGVSSSFKYDLALLALIRKSNLWSADIIYNKKENLKV